MSDGIKNGGTQPIHAGKEATCCLFCVFFDLFDSESPIYHTHDPISKTTKEYTGKTKSPPSSKRSNEIRRDESERESSLVGSETNRSNTFLRSTKSLSSLNKFGGTGNNSSLDSSQRYDEQHLAPLPPKQTRVVEKAEMNHMFDRIGVRLSIPVDQNPIKPKSTTDYSQNGGDRENIAKEGDSHLTYLNSVNFRSFSSSYIYLFLPFVNQNPFYFLSKRFCFLF